MVQVVHQPWHDADLPRKGPRASPNCRRGAPLCLQYKNRNYASISLGRGGTPYVVPVGMSIRRALFGLFVSSSAFGTSVRRSDSLS